jgi:hypothetical protein
MEAASHSTAHHHHHELPASGPALNAVAASATLHCLTGCALGEITGMVLGTALGFSRWETVALAVVLAFLFGYTLTSLPLLRAGLALSAVVPIALATDTFSIAVMEIVDNAIMLLVPGAMESGVGDILFWGALSFALVVAGIVAFPVNRWLITRGKGHAVLHNSGHHPNFPTRAVAAIAVTAFVFGSAVLVTEALTSDGESMHGEMQAAGGGHGADADRHAAPAASDADVPGLAVSSNGHTLELDHAKLPRGRDTTLGFRVTDGDGRAVRDFDREHEKRMHLIVVRRDTEEFQHLHPRMNEDGRWTTLIRLPEAGSYRVFADFSRNGEKTTLGADLAVDGPLQSRPLPTVSSLATTSGGYEVRLRGARSTAGTESELEFVVTRAGRPVKTEPYLGAGGHLVALREGDLGYLHTHPAEHPATDGHDDAVRFTTRFPTASRYRLYFQFKHQGRVHTAAFTRTAI